LYLSNNQDVTVRIQSSITFVYSSLLGLWICTAYT
jgi:hypothetical protein